MLAAQHGRGTVLATEHPFAEGVEGSVLPLLVPAQGSEEGLEGVRKIGVITELGHHAHAAEPAPQEIVLGDEE